MRTKETNLYNFKFLLEIRPAYKSFLFVGIRLAVMSFVKRISQELNHAKKHKSRNISQSRRRNDYVPKINLHLDPCIEGSFK